MSVALSGCLLLALAGCTREEDAGTVESTESTEGTEVSEAVGGRVIRLDQGWSPELQQKFWYTSQGSRILRYEWFLALEQAGSTEPFRSDANIDRFRYIPEKPSALNPDGLPVGFAMDRDARTGERYFGWTCAACHSNQLEYKGTGMRIDGAPTLADSQMFLVELVAALEATLEDNARFERFARKVLAGKYSVGTAEELRRAVFDRTEDLAERNRQDMPAPPAGAAGYARLDAFGGIFNQVLAADLDLPQNYRPANAPVSYPFLWDTPQHDVVQWVGIAPNFGPGPLARNVGEILGVFAQIDVDPKALPLGYSSSANIPGLGELETWLITLWSPQWPMEVLPALDAEKAARGRDLYQANCQSCHVLIDRVSPGRRIDAVMTPVAEVGTDPATTTNIATRMAQTGRLKGKKAKYLIGETMGAEVPAQDILDNVVIGAIAAHPGKAVHASLEEFVEVREAKYIPLTYKARSLNGIWATAPYLHNGSVPNLWSLLQPVDKRPKEFYVGTREIDPVNVGFVSDAFPGGFRFDTSLAGNSNAGHTYGTQLTDAEKWDLVEYLKSL